MNSSNWTPKLSWEWRNHNALARMFNGMTPAQVHEIYKDRPGSCRNPDCLCH